MQLYRIFNFWCFIMDKYRFSRRLFLVCCPRALAFDLTLKFFKKYSENRFYTTFIIHVHMFLDSNSSLSGENGSNERLTS